MKQGQVKPHHTSYFVLAYLFIFIFSFLFVSFSSVIQDIPNQCIPTNTNHSINLSQYFNYGSYYDSYYSFLNPDDSYTRYFAPLFYYSIEQTCYDFYNWIDGDGWPTLYINTGGSECNVSDSYIQICQTSCGDKLFGNEWDINVSDSCDWNQTGGGTGSNTTLLDGLVSMYELDEQDTTGSGTLTDELGNNDATNVGCDNETGKIGTSYDCVASNSDHIDLNFVPATGSSDRTFCSWVYPQSLSQEQVFIAYGGSSTYQKYSFRINGASNDVLRIEIQAGGYDSNLAIPSINSWYFVCSVFDGTTLGDHTLYLGFTNGTLFSDTATGSETLNTASTYDAWLGESILNAGQEFDGMFDLVYIYNRSLNSTEISELFNSGSGLSYSELSAGEESNLTITVGLSSAITDKYINNSYNLSFDMGSHFTNESDYIITWEDPWTSLLSNLSTQALSSAMYTLNADYYDIYLFPNGTVIFTSYARTGNFSLTGYGCNNMASYAYYADDCKGSDFTLVLNSSLESPQLLQSFSSPVNISTTIANRATYASNVYFQYWDRVEFIYPDSNNTGVLDSSFPFSYGSEYNITLPNGTNWLYRNVTVSCDSSQTSFNITLGDINITTECQGHSSWFYLTAYENYNNTVWFNASNSLGFVIDDFLLYSGDPAFGYSFPDNESNETTNSTFNNSKVLYNPFNFSKLYDAMPKAENELSNSLFVIITVLMVLVPSFVFFIVILRLKFVGFWIVFLITWLYMLFLSVGSYLPWVYVVVPPVLIIFYYVLKMAGGGS